MVVGGSQKETLDLGFVLLGTRQKDLPVILRELMLPDGFDFVSPSFTIREVITELYGPQLTYLTVKLDDTGPIGLNKYTCYNCTTTTTTTSTITTTTTTNAVE
ncbi:unnamed protein product [Schistosoma mattheei]|uniref:Uncharacterized protein n=1 Tax=Schistosoma mattheei TaxID=31246 RepID=A0A183PVS2_9TREM|nr:unnamed protein product [Schistosoma mattheei]